MKRILYFLFLPLAFILSCKKNHDKELDKPKGALSVTIDGKPFQSEANSMVQVFGDTAEVRIFAESPEVKVELHARSTTHTNGVGDYYLYCCNNDFWVRTSGKDVHYEGMRATNGLDQLGSVKITQNDGKSYEGTFVITGRNSDSVAKQVSGAFKVYY